MSECKHDFIGSAEAVRCRICGLTLSAAEYIRYLHSEEPTETEPEVLAEEPTETEPEVLAEAPTEHVKPPTKRRTRKKVNTDEGIPKTPRVSQSTVSQSNDAAQTPREG